MCDTQEVGRDSQHVSDEEYDSVSVNCSQTSAHSYSPATNVQTAALSDAKDCSQSSQRCALAWLACCVSHLRRN